MSCPDRHGTSGPRPGDADGLLALVAEHRPDIAVVDIRMPLTHTAEGLDAALRIRREYPDVAILLRSVHVDVDHALELLDGGQGVGYLLKSRVTDVAEFVETVQRIAGGASVMDPALVQELVAARRRNDPRQR
ncbi:Transcriptional regulatory protein DegU [Gordonia rubripertincta]|nr:response regulator transcription factor [Gordonia rubripertincta]ASR01871.1 Transcriptional regulatory protein DegU [Gordonia rubripertincta]